VAPMRQGVWRRWIHHKPIDFDQHKERLRQLPIN
jgi:hypothetical protein